MSSRQIHQEAIALSSIGRGASMGVISGPAYHYGRWGSGGNPQSADAHRVRGQIAITDASRVRREGNTLRIAVPTQSGEPCEVRVVSNGQYSIFYVCCGGHCAPMPIVFDPNPGNARPRRTSSYATVGAQGANCWTGVGHNNIVMLCCDVGDDTHCIPMPITFGPLPGAESNDARARVYFKTSNPAHEITHQGLRHGNPPVLAGGIPQIQIKPGALQPMQVDLSAFAGAGAAAGAAQPAAAPPAMAVQAMPQPYAVPYYPMTAYRAPTVVGSWREALIANGGPQKNCFYLVVDDFRLYRCCSGSCTEIFLDGSEGPTTWNLPTGAIDVTAEARTIHIAPQARVGVRYGNASIPTRPMPLLRPVRNPPRTRARTYRNPMFAATTPSGPTAAPDCSNPNTPASACKWICLPMPSPNDPHDEHCVRVPQAAQLRGAFFTSAPDVAPTIRERIAARYRGW